LIAEDDFTSRIMLAEVLKKSGHEVVETTNGLEAWEAMQQPNPPRMAILDWMMPEMDGVEVCRSIRTLETDRPPYVIMLTTKLGLRDKSIDRGYEKGVN
jgi:CheY-like chemotaxis protein